MAFSLQLLRLFVAVARHGSVTAAARALELTQPAISKGVKTLERQVGVPLLVRTPGGVRPTDAGAALLQHARVIFAEAQAAQDDLRAHAGLEQGTLTIGASPTIATYVLPRFVRAFRRRYPNVSASIMCAPTRVVARQFAEREIDCALTEAAVEDPRVVAERWIHDDLVPIAAESHPIVARPSLAALAEESFVLREPGSGTRDIVLRALRRRGIEPRRVLVADNSEVIRRLVAAGLGVAIDSRLAIADLVALGRLAVIDLPALNLRRPLYRLVLRTGRQSAAARAFGELLTQTESTAAVPGPPSAQLSPPSAVRSGKNAATVVPRPT